MTDFEACLSDLVVSDANAQALAFETGGCVDLPCDDADGDSVCDNVDDCVGEYDDCGVCNGGNADQDECGECFGDGIDEGACDCDGNVEDECGECGGDGIDEGACDCDGNVEDDCGVCGGDGVDEDADGICDDVDLSLIHI